jgi:hypothetical protein
VPLAAILNLRCYAHGLEIHEPDGTGGAEDFAGALEVLAGPFPQLVRLDQVRDGRHP